MSENEKDSDSNRKVGAGAVWLGWQKLDAAIVAFLDATTELLSFFPNDRPDRHDIESSL
jgi:hypothetical protein